MKTPKKIAPLSPELKWITFHLEEVDENEIKDWAYFEWKYPKGDMRQFAGVLKRFKAIISRIASEYDLHDEIQVKEFSPETKELILAIMHFQTVLYENCVNRRVLDFYQLRYFACFTTDLDILSAVINFMMKVTIKSKYIFLQFREVIIEMCTAWSFKELLSQSPANNTITMSFYATDTNLAEGLHDINETIIPGEQTDNTIFHKLREKYKVPAESQHELLNKIRLANTGTNIALKKQLLLILLNSISIMTTIAPEGYTRQGKLLYDPNLIPDIMNFISHDTQYPMDIQACAMYTLASLGMFMRSKVTTALNLSENHGIILHICEKLYRDCSNYTYDFVEAYFKFLSNYYAGFFVNASLLTSSGLVPKFLIFMDQAENKSDIYLKILCEIMSLLNLFELRSGASADMVLTLDDAKPLLNAIDIQADDCITARKNNQAANEMSLLFIGRALSCMAHILERAGSDHLMSLMETKFPSVIKKIWSDINVFNPRIFAITTTLISGFINKEPTSLPLLQEIQLPQIWLENFNNYDQPTFKFMKSAILIFDALCLNAEGEKIFKELDPLPHFFKLLTLSSFVTLNSDDSQMGYLGVCLDEFIRHHSGLEEHVYQILDEAILYVIEIGNKEESKPEDNRHRLHVKSHIRRYDRKKSSCLLLEYIQLVSEFLGGLFKGEKHVENFIKSGGTEKLLKYYDLPYLPYNYSQSNAFQSLAKILRILFGKAPMDFAKLIIDKVYEKSRFIFTEFKVDTSLFVYVNDNEGEKANLLLHKLSVLRGYTGLLPIVYTPSYSRFQDFMPDIIKMSLAPNPNYENAIQLIGDVHRAVLYQDVLWRCTNTDDDYFKNWLNINYKYNIDHEYYIINIRRYFALLSETASLLASVFPNIVMNSLTHRSIILPRLSKCIRAKKIAQQLALMIKRSLYYLDEPFGDYRLLTAKYTYLSAICSMISMLLQDDRETPSLITPLIVALEDDKIIHNLVLSIFTITQTQLDIFRSDGTLGRIIETYTEMLLSLLYQFGLADDIRNSQHTILVTSISSSEDGVHGYPFSLHLFITQVQHELSLITILTSETLLNNLSKHGAHLLLKCIRQNIEAKPEVSDFIMFLKNEKLPYFMANKRVLKSQGYDEDDVIEALRKHRYGLCALLSLYKQKLAQHKDDSEAPKIDVSGLDVTSPLVEEEKVASIEILQCLGFDSDLAKDAIERHENFEDALSELSGGEPLNKEETHLQLGELDFEAPQEIKKNLLNYKHANDKNDDPFRFIYNHENEFTQEEDSKYAVNRRNLLLLIQERNRKEILKILSKLVDSRDDLDFDIRDLIIAICKTSTGNFEDNLTNLVQLFFQNIPKEEANGNSFESVIKKIRVFALMLRESSIRKMSSLLISQISSIKNWFGFLDHIIAHAETVDPKCITTLFFILEAALTRGDEPEEVPFPFADLCPFPDTEDKIDTSTFLTTKNRGKLLLCCITLLKVKTLPQDTVVATLRIIVRLTKHHLDALKFMTLGGLEQIFWRVRTKLNIIKLQQVYIIMILRHVLEAPNVLTAQMQEEFISWTHRPTAKNTHITSVIENNKEMVLRDPDTFIDVSSKVCRMVPDNSYKVIYLNDKKKTLHQATDNGVETPTIEKMFSRQVIHFLLDELMVVASATGGRRSPINDAYTAILLQCLFELTSSYPICKYEIISYKATANEDTTSSETSEIEGTSVYKLVDTLMSYTVFNSSSHEGQYAEGISKWANALLIAMCFESSSMEEATSSETLKNVRETILEILYHRLNRYYRSEELLANKYSQYFILCEAVYSILIAKKAISIPSLNRFITKESIVSVAKIMLEKNFVPFLISVAKDVDVNHPSAKIVLNSIMRPVEELTRIAAALAAKRKQETTEPGTSDSPDANGENILSLLKIDPTVDVTIHKEVYQLYRSSSLNIVGGPVEDEDSSNLNTADIVFFENLRPAAEDQNTVDSDDYSNASSERDIQEEMGSPLPSDASIGTLTYDDWYMSETETVESNQSSTMDYDDNSESAWRYEDMADGGQYIKRKGVSRIFRQFLRAEIASDLNDSHVDVSADKAHFFLVLEHSDLDNGLIENPYILMDDDSNDKKSNDSLLHPLLKSTSTSTNLFRDKTKLYRVYQDHLDVYQYILGDKVTRVMEKLLQEKRDERNNYMETWDDFDVPEKMNEKYHTNYKEKTAAIKQIRGFEPLSTIDRWTQEVSMVYTDSVASSVARKVSNTVLTRLKEISENSENDYNQDALVECKCCGVVPCANTETNSNIDINSREESSNNSEYEEQSDLAQARPNYDFNAILDFAFYESVDEDTDNDSSDEVGVEPVDMDVTYEKPTNDLDIDLDFLNALPDDVRDELVNKKTSNKQPVAECVVEESFSPEFLDALPLEMRTEVLQEERVSMKRRQNKDGSYSSNDHIEEPLHKPTDKEREKLKDVAVLLRFLFTPRSIAKPLLCKTLLNLCKDDYMHGHLILFMISILKSGKKDLDGVDQYFVDVGIFTKDEIAKEAGLANKGIRDSSSPDIIIRGCLDLISHLASTDQRTTAYFLTENKKATAKIQAKYPLDDLFELLKDPNFVNSPSLTNQLMNMIALICKPISQLAKSSKLNSHVKLPIVSNRLLQQVVSLISSRECGGALFKHSLVVISHLAFLDGALQSITQLLISAARSCSNSVQTDLETMMLATKKLELGSELDRSHITLFSSSSCSQGSLVRVVEMIEYLYTCHINPSFYKPNKNKKKLLQIYQQLHLEPLWEKLSDCITLLQKREDTAKWASVFLPLFDVLTIVSKYTLSNKGRVEGKPINAQGKIFIDFIEKHKDVMNLFISKNPSLISGSFAVMLRVPRLIDFENKRKFFYQKLHEHKDHEFKLFMNIRRNYVLEDTFDEFRMAGDIKDVKLYVEFTDEDGVDEGGLLREWLSLLSKDIFDPNNGLFVVSAADKLTYQPNRASDVNSDHLQYFEFVGLLIAKMIYDRRLMDVHFTRSFYKHILKRPVDYRDVEAIDPAYFKSLVWMLENDITDIIDLTFSMDTSDFGVPKVIELKENGCHIAVTEENKQEYVTLVANQKLYLDIKEQVEYFMEGFYSIIPANLIAIFNEQELELLIAGLPDIDIDDWIANTVYEGYSLNSPQIKWFWRAVRSFSKEERAKLLQFSTGTARVPIEGFSHLQGSNGIQKFQIHKDFGDIKRLPSAHTCFNQIDIPAYTSYKDLRANLFKAITECTTGFAFA